MYCELHCHTHYSLLDGASSPEALLDRAVALEMPALAITDHDNLCGSVLFWRSAQKRGIQAIIGAEITLAHGSHLTLLAETQEGYANLSRLIATGMLAITDRGAATDAATRRAPRLTIDDVAHHAAGLLCLSGCRHGAVAAAVATGDADRARKAAGRLVDIFGRDRFWIELQRHWLPEDSLLDAGLQQVAQDIGVDVVATNDVHYAEPEGYQLHDILTATRYNASIGQLGARRRPNNEYYLKSASDMDALFADCPRALAATSEIAERCRVSLDFSTRRLPAFPAQSPDFPHGVPADSTPFHMLHTLCQEGLRRKFRPITPAAVRQLAHELAVIMKAGLVDYFLIVWDIVRFSRDSGIRCQGRGSAASSLVAYLLGITPVDPLRYDLLFERFLSDQTDTMPDIDIDFAGDRRDEVIAYVYQRYGAEHAAMVCNTVTYRERSAFRDVARALGFAAEDVDRICRSRRAGDEWSADGSGTFVPSTVGPAPAGLPDSLTAPSSSSSGAPHQNPVGALTTPLSPSPSPTSWERGDRQEVFLGGGAAQKYEKGTSPAPRQEKDGANGGDANQERRAPLTPPAPDESGTLTPQNVQWVDSLAAQLTGTPRHLSVHVGGMLVTAQPLVEVVPVERAAKPGIVVAQWDKDSVEDAGLIKIDLLSLCTLGMLSEVCARIAERHHVDLDLDALPMDDPGAYRLMAEGDTIGCFQVESRAQTQMLPRLKPVCFEDLIIQVSIVRPGPIQGGMVHPYLRRRQGLEPVIYLHPCLEPALKETLGVIIFQEQVIRVAVALADFTPGEADRLRRAMSRSRSAGAMEELRARFVAGAARNDVSQEIAEEAFRQLQGFATYGFCKSHAAAFALVAYQTLWLKAHYPLEFYCALLNHQPMGFYSPEVVINDAHHHGISLLRPDVCRSLDECSLEGDSLRLGLRYLQGLGEAGRERVLSARKIRAFTNMADFCRRTKLPRSLVRDLIRSGALESFGARRPLLWALGDVEYEEHRLVETPGIPADLPALSEAEAMQWDYELLGLSPGDHPMRLLRPRLSSRVLVASDLARRRTGEMVEVAGLVAVRQAPPTAKGHLFITLEDETGLVNLVIRPNLFAAHRKLLRGASVLWAKGVIQRESQAVSILVREVQSLTDWTDRRETS